MGVGPIILVFSQTLAYVGIDVSPFLARARDSQLLDHVSDLFEAWH